jgi:hypothetical protein
MNNRPDEKPTDYIGLLGKDPKSNPETAKAWRELRDMVVHGPRLEFTFATKPRLWPWQWQWSSITSKRWSCGGSSFTNLPKGGGKTEVMRRMFDTGEELGMHGYMNYPGLFNDVHIATYEPKEHQRESLAELAKRFADSIPSVRGKVRNNFPIVGAGVDARLGMSFLSGDRMLSGGFKQGELSTIFGGLPGDTRLKIMPRVMPKYFVDMEYTPSDEEWAATIARLLGEDVLQKVNMRDEAPQRRVAFDIESRYGRGSQFYLGAHSFDMQYLYDPADHLTRLYEKARKKFKHKDAVNHIVKRQKHGRKWAAKQLEVIGAAYEEKKRDELREKARKTDDAKWQKQYGDFM